jgi:aminoglycoside N3'-acetyltransferase
LAPDIRSALDGAGVSNGDSVFVHSGMRGLSLRLLADDDRDGDIAGKAARIFHDALGMAVGDNGTVAAPAFFYEYARYRTPFDAATSPADKTLGIYPSLLLTMDGMRRSLCPPVSIVAIGNQASRICDTGTAYGFGVLSPWQRLTDMDVTMLFWDVSPRMITFGHHIEALVGVPHLYNKIYDTPVRGLDGPHDGPVVSAVRYLDERFAIVYDLERFLAEAGAAGLITTHTWGTVSFHLVGFRSIQDFLYNKLRDDPFYLLSAPPRFIDGTIPTDGATGAGNPKLAFQVDRS